jgi:predicted esterase
MVNMTLALLCLNLASKTYDDRNLSASFTTLLDEGGNGSDYHPRFLVIRKGSDLFIAVRGSVEISDFHSVLDFRSVEFLTKFRVHRGAFVSAKWLLKKCRPLISEHSGNIIFTGHSFGGSVAAVAAAMLRLGEDLPRVSAYCFATLPAFSVELSKQSQSFITTWVVNQDAIPSLNPRNIKTIFESLGPVRTSDQGQSAIAKLVESFAESMLTQANKIPKTEELSAKIREESLKLATRVSINLNVVEQGGKLVNPGAAYHVIITDNVPNVIQYDENVPLESILEIFAGIKDHMIGIYRNVLGRSMKAKYPKLT